MIFSKKGAWSTLMKMILMVILLSVVLYLLARAPTKPLTDCLGTCVEKNQCKFPNVIASNKCTKDGKTEKGVCCVSLEDLEKKDNEIIETSPETTVCNKDAFPIFFYQEPNYRYKCEETTNVTLCNLNTNKIESRIDACTLQKNHLAYYNCCLKQTENNEIIKKIEPKINLRIGEGKLTINFNKLDIEKEYKFILNTEGSEVTKCKVNTFNELGNLVQGNLAFNEEKDGNCKDLQITLTPKQSDLEELKVNNEAILILKIELSNNMEELLMEDVRTFIIN